MGKRILSSTVVCFMMLSIIGTNKVYSITDFDLAVGNVNITSAGDYTIKGTSNKNTIKVESNIVGDVNITLDNVKVDVNTINDACAFDIGDGSNVSLLLKEGTTNILKSGTTKAGVKVEAPVGKKAASITIGGTGKLIVTGGQSYDSYGAGSGIGSNGMKDEGNENTMPSTGNITINSGIVEATGGAGSYYAGTGIGGGTSSSSGTAYAVNGGCTTVHGGTIRAIGGDASGYFAGTGIGGGTGMRSGNAGKILIDGGNVTAKSGDGKWSSAAIGGGCANNYEREGNSYITIEGNASVNALAPNSKVEVPNIGTAYSNAPRWNSEINIGGNANVKVSSGKVGASYSGGVINGTTLNITRNPKIIVLSANKIGDIYWKSSVGQNAPILPINADTINSTVPIISCMMEGPISTTSDKDISIKGDDLANSKVISIPANYSSFATTVNGSGNYFCTVDDKMLQEVSIDNYDFKLKNIINNYNVQISPLLESIEITKPPTKLLYKIGNTLDVTGIVVTGKFNDGTTKNVAVTNDNIIGFDSSKNAQNQEVTVKVARNVANYKISVDKLEGPELTGVSMNDATDTLIGMTNKMEFSLDGENWVKYDNEKSNLPDLTGNKVIKVRFAETDTHKVGREKEFKFTIPVLIDIAITKQANKLVYKVGDVLDITGLEVTGNYNDGTTKVESITKDNITGFDSSKGFKEQELTVTVGEKKTSYKISVEKLEGLELTGVSMNDATDTLIGITDKMEFSVDGENWVKYDNEKPNLPDLTGNKVIKVRFIEIDTHKAGKEKEFKFTIPILSKVAITKPANKLSYKVGDTLDITGLEVTGYYNDGTTKIESISKDNITGFDSSKGFKEQELIVSVGEKKTSYRISVEKLEGPELTGVSMDDARNTLIGMTADMEFSIDGISWSKYSEGIGHLSNLPDLTGNITLRVRFVETDTHKPGKEKWFNFTIPILIDMQITKPANKLIYKVGDTLDITGLEVTGIYNDGTTKIEDITKDNIKGFDSSKGFKDQELTVTVGEKKISYKISVEKLDGGEVTGVSVDDEKNILIGITNEMEFSVDGVNWTKYNKENPNLPDLTGYIKIQVRNEESETHKVGAIKTFEFTIPAPIKTTIKGNVVDKNGKYIQGVDIKVTTDANGTKSLEFKSQDALVIKAANGATITLTNIPKIGFDIKGDVRVSITEDGVIKVTNLTKGTDVKIPITYELQNGQKIVVGFINVKEDNQGNVCMTSSLIDPYGTITDIDTGKTITGADVRLYYADTARNKAAGKVAGSLVELPIIEGFKPNDNKNPQTSDALGTYAYMVFPEADYYVVVKKDGYEEYKSPVISVEKEIVKHDIKMKAIKPTSNIDKNYTEKIATIIKTGSIIDTNLLIGSGLILILVGLIVVRRKRA